MQINNPVRDRRQILKVMAGLSTTALLAACGGGGRGGTGDSGISVLPGGPGTGTGTTPAPLAAGSHPLNLLLMLGYLGAQFYGMAAHGMGLPTSLTGGIGQAGVATGARLATFGDAAIAGYAAELAEDKQAHVVALRAQLGPLAAAQPPLDLSTGASGAFAVAARGAGIVPAGASFDPYASDENFLIGAFLIENAVAAAYRTLLTESDDPAVVAIASAHLADAIYHGGLIRTLLDDKAVANAAIGTAIDRTSTLLSAYDGSNVGDQTLGGASGESADLIDPAGRAFPFTRARHQVLKRLFLSSSAVGGFLPAGANGVPA